jgi:hypothetical protein
LVRLEAGTISSARLTIDKRARTRRNLSSPKRVLVDSRNPYPWLGTGFRDGSTARPERCGGERGRREERGERCYGTLSQEDCERADRNSFISSGVVALVSVLVAFAFLRLLERRRALSAMPRFWLSVVLGGGVALGADQVFGQSATFRDCLDAQELCRFVLLCGSHPLLRSVLLAAIPAVVVIVVVEVVRSKVAH